MADPQVRRRLSEEMMNRGIGMLEAWLSQREVARVLGVSQSVVSRMWTRFHLTENVMHQTPEVCLFVLRFYGPVNPMGSCRARSVYLTTRLLDRLSPLSGKPVLCIFFRQKLTTALLESAEGRE